MYSGAAQLTVHAIPTCRSVADALHDSATASWTADSVSTVIPSESMQSSYHPMAPWMKLRFGDSIDYKPLIVSFEHVNCHTDIHVPAHVAKDFWPGQNHHLVHVCHQFPGGRKEYNNYRERSTWDWSFPNHNSHSRRHQLPIRSAVISSLY
jgi:hypothetical protein